MLSRPVWLLAGLYLVAASLAVQSLAQWVSPGAWWPALIWPDPASVREVVAADSLLPRVAVALLCGAALGLSGGVAQVALRNPLASPGTLGVSAGASLALALATLYVPGALAGVGRDAVAAGGGIAGIGLVLLLSSRRMLDPAAVALAGLAVGLYAGSVASVLSVLHTRQLAGLFVWSAGSLAQLGWDVPHALLLRVAVASAVVGLLARPLHLLQLPDEVSTGLGVNVRLIRMLALAVSVALATSVVGQVGVIGFVGLAAPALARLGNAGGGSAQRTLLWSPLLGAGLLLLTDQVVERLSGTGGVLLPTGAFTALLGAPLLLWLLPLVAANTAPPATAPAMRRAAYPGVVLLAGSAGVLALVAAALLAGRSAEGWNWSAALLAQRAPRVAAAGMAGVALGIAGTMLQRLLGNPMASPEVLGLGTGALAGSTAALWLGWVGVAARLSFGIAGAGAVLALLLLFARRRGGSTQLVLAGIALSAAGEAVMALLLASGDPRAETVLVWLSGSTYGTAPALAVTVGGALLVLLVATTLSVRWLELLPLGRPVAGALGVPVGAARAAMLGLAAALTAIGTLMVGPLSFVGLVAPHCARLLGVPRAGGQLASAALAGAAVTVAADWLGRNVLFPSEVPAGLLAALLGGPVLLAGLWRGRA